MNTALAVTARTFQRRSIDAELCHATHAAGVSPRTLGRKSGMTARVAVIALTTLVLLAIPGAAAAKIESDGRSAKDRRMAGDLVAYFERNFRERPWFDRVRSVRADRGVFTVRT